MRYIYPAIFTKEDDGKYSVVFPDLEGCYTCGEDLADAMYMAEDVLAYTLFDLEKREKDIPLPSENVIKSKVPANSFMSFVACNTLEYHKVNSKRFKTVSEAVKAKDEENIQDKQIEIRRNMLKRLMTYRTLLGLSQKDVADRIGVSRPNISRFESEEYNPTLDMIVKIADSMNLDVVIDFKERK